MTTGDGGVGAGRRLAAVAALVTLAGAVVVLVTAGVHNAGALVLLLVGAIALVVGGWQAVSRRGPARYLAIPLAVVGLAALVAGFVVADLSALRITLTVVLTGVSVATARVALHRGAGHRPGAGLGAAPAAHPVLLMNPRSGGGKVERFDLVEECRRRGIEPIVLGPGDDLVELAERAVAEGADVLGMAGGDGSQALVAGIASRHRLPHVVVPAGTRNHFALDLGLDRDDVVGALDAYADGLEVRVDLATVNGRIFVNNASLGVYAKIVQSPEYREAKSETTLAMLPDLIGPEATPPDLRFTGPDGDTHHTAHMILVSNNAYELDRLRGRGTRPRLDDGVLGVAVATVQSAGDVAQLVALETTRQLRRFHGWLEWTADHFEIDSDGPVEIGVDGEALVMDPPLVFEVLPSTLRVRVPRHAPGASPAGRAVHLAALTTVVDLLRVAGGRPGEDRPAE